MCTEHACRSLASPVLGLEGQGERKWRKFRAGEEGGEVVDGFGVVKSEKGGRRRSRSGRTRGRGGHDDGEAGERVGRSTKRRSFSVAFAASGACRCGKRAW